MIHPKQDQIGNYSRKGYDDMASRCDKWTSGLVKIGICVPYSQLTLCAKWSYNVHYYRIYKEHRNLRIRKHVKTSCSGTKPFY